MSIPLPPMPLGTSTEITYTSSSVDQTPYMGGPIQRLARMGDRWKIKVQCRPMYAHQAGPVVTTLIQGLKEKVLVTIPQPGVDMTKYGNGNVAGAVAGGIVVPHTGGGEAKFVGQYVSIVNGGVRYLHQIVGVSGANLTIAPPLKKPLVGGEVMEFGSPKLEGFVAGNSQNWTIGLALNLGLTFEVGEAQ